MHSPGPCTTRQANSARQVAGGLARRFAFAFILTATSTTPAQADFGRLFFTAEQRDTLDQPEPAAPPPPTPTPVERAPASAPAQRIDGFVRHSSGEITVWLDGTPGPLPPGLSAPPFPALELIQAHRPQDRLRAGDLWQVPASTTPAAHETQHSALARASTEAAK